jgi:hypothetical protein
MPGYNHEKREYYDRTVFYLLLNHKTIKRATIPPLNPHPIKDKRKEKEKPPYSNDNIILGISISQFETFPWKF